MVCERISNIMYEIFKLPFNITPSHREISDYIKYPSNFIIDVSTDDGCQVVGDILSIIDEFPFFSLFIDSNEKNSIVENILGVKKPVNLRIDLSHPSISSLKYTYETNYCQYRKIILSYTFVEVEFRNRTIKFPIECIENNR